MILINRILVSIFIFCLINVNLLSLDFSSTNWTKPTNITILNSQYNDYSPIYNIFDNLIYFSSDRTNYSMFYHARINNNTFETPQILKSGINKSRNHQNYLVFDSPNTAYYTSFKQTEILPVLNIYKSYFMKNGWTEGVVDDTLNISISNFQLTISPDKKLAIFVSNKDNKPDDTDLWMLSRNEDGSWNEPIKLDEINTQLRELTPYLVSVDTLFFASDGYGGPGGLDLYYSIRRNGLWLRPTPMFDLNTEFDESDLTVFPDNTVIFASNRPGGLGGLDLYLSEPIRIEIEEETIDPIISIQTQATTLQVDKNDVLTGYNFPLSIPNEYWLEPQRNDLVSLYISAALDTLSNRLSQNKNKIIISNNDFKELILNQFSKRGIDIKQIQLEKGTLSTKMLKINSIDKSLLKSFDITTTNIQFKPPALDIRIDAQIKDAIDSSEVLLNYADQFNKINVDIDTLPIRFYYDLEPFKNLFSNLDSINIVYKYKLNNNFTKEFSKSISISRNHQKSRLISLSNQKYIDFYFFFTDQDELNELINLNKELLDDINDEIDVSKSVLIQYYTPNNQKLAKDLSIKINRKNKYIETIYNSQNEILPIYSKYVYKLRIIKY